ncbi:MAG TPA: nuclear transport factor 2 family protein [Anaeromyxobacteraceae bacterium]|nr:nuclear transport factor 2 family protein [Anaeromyxobacteraceae bacterium]
MLDKRFAEEFAAAWFAAWNAHDLDRVLAHYADDFTMRSPIIVRLAGEPSGTLRGKKAVGSYWAAALSRFPDLRFEPVAVFAGVDSVVVHYQSPAGPAAEALRFGSHGLVVDASAHYA